MNDKILVDQFKISSNDTGSIQVQIAQLTQRISQISEHVNSAHKDKSAKRGLEILVGKRRRFLQYLKKNDKGEFVKVTKALGLR